MTSYLFLETCGYDIISIFRKWSYDAIELMTSYHYEMVTSFQFPYIRVLLTFNHSSLI